MVAPRIESYQFGHIVIDGQRHDRDVIILPDRVLGNWWRGEGHALQPEDLAPVLAASPEVLIVGKGAYSRMRVTSATFRALEAANIELVALATEDACKRYNAARDKKDAAAALHLTC